MNGEYTKKELMAALRWRQSKWKHGKLCIRTVEPFGSCVWNQSNCYLSSSGVVQSTRDLMEQYHLGRPVPVIYKKGLPNGILEIDDEAI